MEFLMKAECHRGGNMAKKMVPGFAINFAKPGTITCVPSIGFEPTACCSGGNRSIP